MTEYPEHIREQVLEFKKQETQKFAIELQKRCDTYAKQLLADHERRKKQNTNTQYQYAEYDYSKLKSSSQNSQTSNLLSDYIIKPMVIESSWKQGQKSQSLFTPAKEPEYVVVVGCESSICHIRGCGIIKLKQQRQITKEEVLMKRLCQQCQIRLDRGTY